MSYRGLHGDVIEMIKTLADNSVDAIVTDPPYHLTTGKKGGTGPASVDLTSPYGRARVTTGFMGMTWDGGDIAYSVPMWKECLRVLKPGGHLLSFGGSRTYHRMACAVEDAGFEIRDQIQWVFGSGFPKSMDVSKALDKTASVEREPGQPYRTPGGGQILSTFNNWQSDSIEEGTQERRIPQITIPVTDAAKQWDGWGTALKPAHEPIVLARKPLIGTVAANVLTHGTGALNIAACRIPGEAVPINKLEAWSGFGQEIAPEYTATMSDVGRWPANLIHDGSEEVLEEFAKYGERAPGRFPSNSGGIGTDSGIYSAGVGRDQLERTFEGGTAARFFYCAKADREDRNEGCEDFDKKPLNWSSGTQSPGTFQAEGTDRSSHNNHPTVKPTDLMRYLCKMITPPGGTVLDPFMGSGSTGKAALYEGFHFIGIEKDANYCEIAKARMEYVLATDVPLLRAIEKEERSAEVLEITQEIFDF